MNYAITDEMLREILPLIEKGVVEISSVHHPFPRLYNEEYNVNSILLGFLEREKREKSIELTKKSIDYGVRVGAKAVVIHPSEVPVSADRHYDALLKKLYNEGKKNSIEYKILFEEMINHRNAKSSMHLELVKDSLEQLCDYIYKKNYKIYLGIENRAMCHQIPDFYEAHYLTQMLKDSPVYFWYDIGHGIMMDNLGMFNNLNELKKMKDRIIGIHIHDAIGMHDHMCPYIHSNYIDNFIDVIKDVPIKVLELGADNTTEDIMRGIGILHNKIETALEMK